MSTGALFTLVNNDGKQDKILMATDLLKKRLKELREIRCRNPAIRDTTPTLIDIERTHVIFINAHFKPFAALAYEYNRIAPQDGTAGFGQEVSFSIQEFGDFFSDMCIRVVLEDFEAIVPGDQVHYAEFLGHRLLENVKFEVNGIRIDEYDSDVMNFHYNFKVPEWKRVAWKRCVGQEVPRDALLTQENGVDEYRVIKRIVDGPQTPKAVHTRVEMFIPLLFWFNLDPALAIPSVSIPFGQRFVTVQIANASSCCFGVDRITFHVYFFCRRCGPRRSYRR